MNNSKECHSTTFAYFPKFASVFLNKFHMGSEEALYCTYICRPNLSL